MKNFIPICRDIQQHWIYNDAEYLKTWLEMLLNARYSQDPKTDMYKGALYTLNYGEFIFSRSTYSDRLSISDAKLRRLLKLLIDSNMIEKVSSLGKNKPTIYKIVNYNKYNKQPSEPLQNEHLEGGNDQVRAKSKPSQNQVEDKSKPSGGQVETKSEPLKNIDNKEYKDKKVKLQDRNKEIDIVFDHYCEVFTGYYKTLSLTPTRIKHIKARLEKYSVDQVKQAITNIRTSSYHLGEDKNNDKFYATLEFICRNDEILEKWINHIPKVSTNPNVNMAHILYEKALREEQEGIKGGDNIF